MLKHRRYCLGSTVGSVVSCFSSDRWSTSSSSRIRSSWSIRSPIVFGGSGLPIALGDYHSSTENFGTLAYFWESQRTHAYRAIIGSAGEALAEGQLRTTQEDIVLHYAHKVDTLCSIFSAFGKISFTANSSFVCPIN
jgi:hypothetical protein